MEGALNKFNDVRKGLFNQKGGTFGLVLLAIGAVFFISKISAIVAFVDSLFHLIIVLIAIGAILFILTDKNTRLAIGTMYMMGVRALLGMIIKMNPIAILEDSITKMKKMINKIEEKMGNLDGILESLKEKIRKKKKDLQTCLDNIKVAESQGKKETAAIESRQAVRLKDLIDSYLDIQINTQKWYETLDKIGDMAKLTVQDAENEVAMLKERYEMVKISHSAFKSAMSILKGDPDELALYNQSLEYVNNDMMTKIGEMNRFVNSTGGMFDKMDIESEVFSIKGADLLDQYNKLGIDSLFSTMKETPTQALKSLTNNKPETVVITTQQKMSNTNTKSKYF